MLSLCSLWKHNGKQSGDAREQILSYFQWITLGFFSVLVKSTCKTALKWHFAKGSKLQFGWEKGELKQRSVLGEVRFYVLHQCLHAGLQKGSVLWKTRNLDSSIEA